MMHVLRNVGWIACVIYSTVPAFWLMIHPRAELWRARRRSPYRILLPFWVGMSIATAAITFPWRSIPLYENGWTWLPSAALFCAGFILYRLSHHRFGLAQLGGLPELLHNQPQSLVTTGIRAHLRHPVYLAHLCEMFAWSLGTGLAVCWALTAFAIVTGAFMIKIEDRELEKRLGEEYRRYRSTVPALLPRITII
jgi:protein-S-isoprenylcysteine O-methyltransferase Ste14